MVDLSDISRLRKSLNITQKELARKAGVSQSLIAKIEKSRIDPSFSKARKILDTLDSLSNAGACAQDLMNPNIISVSAGDSLKKAISRMKKANISQMPVIEERKAVGVISEATILEAFIDKGSPSTVADVMKEAPPVLGGQASLPAVTSLLRQYPIVLVADKGKIVGHITKSDILSKAFK